MSRTNTLAERLKVSILNLPKSQRKVLDLFARGYTHAAIGQEVGLNIKTVQAYITSIYNELGIPIRSGRDRRVLAVVAYWRAMGPEVYTRCKVHGVEWKRGEPPCHRCAAGWEEAEE